MAKKEKMPDCNICGEKTIPIAYGLPGPGLWKKAEKGKIHLGGCCIPSMDAMINPPGWCPACESETPIPEDWKKEIPEQLRDFSV